jgi:hypothetical protein
MHKPGILLKFAAAFCFVASFATGAPAQSQPDSQAGAQLGEQSALGGKQGQGTNTQKTTETSPTNVTRFVAGTLLNAELDGSVDSKKLKPGAEVKAHIAEDIKSTDGRTILPKDTKIIGHVTQASAKGAGQPDSSLGLIFDKAMLKSGQEIPLNAGIQAVGAPISNSVDMNQIPQGEPMGGSARGPGGGATAAAPGTGSAGGVPTAPVPGDASGAGISPSNGSGAWNANTRGVVGLSHLSLKTSGGEAGGSVITSTGKNVKLDSGTRLILVTQDVTHETPSK